MEDVCGGAQELLGEGCVHEERERKAEVAFPPQSQGGILEASLAKLGVSAGRETGILFDSMMSLSYSACYPTSVLP